MPHDDRTELQYRIALSIAPAIGPITARKLIEKAGEASDVFKQKREVLEKINGIGPHITGSLNASTLLLEAEKEMEFIEKKGISVLYFKDPGYPTRLNQCKDGPILLYVKGNQGLNPLKSLSVVGTRKASGYGRDLCIEIIRGLADLVPGLLIVSGLAYGIDVIAHQAALKWGLPTVAVLGHGLSTLYPASNRETAKKIIHQGALITDFGSGMKPERNNFLRRNRIIAGLSDATLVVESAEKGGALITAHMAFHYDRLVFAVPGRTVDSKSAGCNNLIKKNMAALTESPEEIIRYLNWDIPEISHQRPARELAFTNQEKKILLAVEQAPGITPDGLSGITGIPIQEVLALLLEMELNEWVSSEPGNCYRARISLASKP
ncbi:MAG: DNA-processing protein DprA [Bacteroidota bacterium]